MKKTLLIIAAIIAVNTTFAQTYFGPRLGINMSKMTGKYWEKDDSEHKNVTGFQFGAVVDHHFSDMISLQMELLYAQKGVKTEDNYSEDGYSSTSTSKETFNTIEIPVLFKATFGGDIKFYGNAGPYFNYKLGGKYESEGSYTGNGTTETYSKDGKIIFDKRPDNYTGDDSYYDPKVYNKVDFGFYIGGGVAKELGPGILTFDIRYGLGFKDFINTDEAFKDDNGVSKEPDGYEAFKNRNLSITVAYMFGGN